MSEKCVHEWYYRTVGILDWQFFCIRCGEKLSMDKFSNHASDLEKNADALNARIAELEEAQRDLREYIEGLEAGIHDETVPEKFDENISALQKEFSMRFENESPVEFFRAIRAGQYPTPPEVQ